MADVSVMKIEKMSALPATLVANSIYVVPASGSTTEVELHFTDNDGTKARKIKAGGGTSADITYTPTGGAAQPLQTTLEGFTGDIAKLKNNVPNTTLAGTPLVVKDHKGTVVFITATAAIDTAGMLAGDMVFVYNNTDAALAITGTALQLDAAVGTKTSIAIKGRSMCSVYALSASSVLITGKGAS